MGNKKVLYPNLMAEIARQGLTISSLAERIGMTRANLAYKLNGQYKITLKDIRSIQEALKPNDKNGDYSLDYLFYQSEE